MLQRSLTIGRQRREAEVRDNNIMHPQDFGPIYTETDLSRFPVEPWNTYSNLIFLLLIFYIAFKTKLDARKYPLLVVSLPILLTGFIGGTVYHASRSDRIWLMMDYLPIMVLSIFVSVHFLRRLLGNFSYALGVALSSFILMRIIFRYSPLPMGLRITIGYSTLAALILVPAYLISKDYPSLRKYLSGAAFLFSLAIGFRYLDSAAILPMGTHFLWHIFGGLSVWSLVLFLINVEEGTYNKSID